MPPPCGWKDSIMFNSLQRPYRSRSGLLFGVCAGLAEYLDISVFWTRVVTLIAFLVTGIWPVGVVYLVLGLLLKKNPYTTGGTACRTGGPPRSRPGNLDERIRNLESIVTREDGDWDTRLNNG